MRNTIFAIIGLSGSGKSTIARYLASHYDIPNISPIAPLKAFIEEVNGLEPGELETLESKSKHPKRLPFGNLGGVSCDYSYQDTLVNLYHFWEEHDPDFGAKMLRNQLWDHAYRLFLGQDYSDRRNEHLTIQSIRNITEVEVIIDFCEETATRLVVFNVSGRKEQQLSSDVAFYELESRILEVGASFAIINDYSDGLYEDINEAMYSLLKEDKERLRVDDLVENSSLVLAFGGGDN